jgi:Tfp pilus assembly ATPase PilU
MNASLYKLHEQGLISEEVALEYSDNENELQQMFRGVYHGTFGREE